MMGRESYMKIAIERREGGQLESGGYMYTSLKDQEEKTMSGKEIGNNSAIVSRHVC